MRAQLSSVLSQITRSTDVQMDRQTEFSSPDRVCIPCSAVKTPGGAGFLAGWVPVVKLALIEIQQRRDVAEQTKSCC